VALTCKILLELPEFDSVWSEQSSEDFVNVRGHRGNPQLSAGLNYSDSKLGLLLCSLGLGLLLHWGYNYYVI
jgi:hypothetical protein